MTSSEEPHMFKRDPHVFETRPSYINEDPDALNKDLQLFNCGLDKFISREETLLCYTLCLMGTAHWDHDDNVWTKLLQ